MCPSIAAVSDIYLALHTFVLRVLRCVLECKIRLWSRSYMAKVAETTLKFCPMVDRFSNINAYGEIDNTSIGRSLARYRATIDALECGEVLRSPPGCQCDGLSGSDAADTYGRRSTRRRYGHVKTLVRPAKEDWAVDAKLTGATRESPSPARLSVAQIHTPLHESCSTFVSCWNGLQ